MENCSSTHFILGNDYVIIYGIYLHKNKDRYFTIGDNKGQKYAFLPSKRQITLKKVSPVSLGLDKFKSKQMNEAEVSLHLTDIQENELSIILYDHKKAFAKEKDPLGVIIGHEVDIIFNIERLYPPLLRRPTYPESPKLREALEFQIKGLLDLGVIRNVGHNEEVEIPTPVIVGWNNGKSRMVGELRALKTYAVPDRYPILKIQIALTQISQAVYISTMDSLKRFHQNVVTPSDIKYLRVIIHCGVYEYLRIPFGIKNAPSHFQMMMNEIFPEELSEGWLIIYIDEIICCSKNWEEHIYGLSRVLKHVNDFASIEKPIYKFCDKKTVFLMTVDRVKAFESLRQDLTTAPLLMIPEFKLSFNIYIDAYGDGLGAALHQVQIINHKPVEGPICLISRQIKPS
ncbi:hypothetical protein O181_083965 [Austropuccinia psidii MF-1]|uniref:Reverse transcriptase domain-containing protein n=1 Tax=Austropuccinia psidii MF-1 TaxID=1389203 RepID=A0A9Q3FUQ8_9BASI|nr:hypothetical protein [Austropuccinia psidii MF-1]